jgi:hypothetical protein
VYGRASRSGAASRSPEPAAHPLPD